MLISLHVDVLMGCSRLFKCWTLVCVCVSPTRLPRTPHGEIEIIMLINLILTVILFQDMRSGIDKLKAAFPKCYVNQSCN